MTPKRMRTEPEFSGEKQQDNIQSINYLNMAGSGQEHQMEQIQNF